MKNTVCFLAIYTSDLIRKRNHSITFESFFKDYHEFCSKAIYRTIKQTSKMLFFMIFDPIAHQIERKRNISKFLNIMISAYTFTKL